jgi:hypothetical protein
VVATDIGRAFAAEVQALVGPDTPDLEVVRRAARAAVAEQAWSQRLGTVLETKAVVELLGVSKQRVSALAKNHRLVVVPDAGRLRFPAVQFAGASPGQRAWLAKGAPDAGDRRAHRPVVGHELARHHPELEDQDPISSCEQAETRRASCGWRRETRHVERRRRRAAPHRPACGYSAVPDPSARIRPVVWKAQAILAAMGSG